MPAKTNWGISDSRRDAERYYHLLLALEHATGKIKDMGEESYASIGDVLGRLLPDLTLALNAKQAFVAVLQTTEDKRKKWLNLTAVYPKEELCGRQLGWSNLFQQLISDGKPKIIAPLGEQARDLIPGLEIFKATSTILVRVQTAGQIYVVGVCNKVDIDIGPFLAADGMALNNIIELVTIGARVGEQRRRELEGIQSTSAVISAELDLDELLPMIAKRAAKVFDAPATSLMLWDESGDNLITRAKWGLSDEYARKQRIPRKSIDSVTRSTDKIQPLLTPDLQHNPFGDVELIKSEHLRTALSAPLLVRDQLIGILNIYSKDEPRYFTPFEQELSQIFANQTAIAVHNAELYTGAQSRAQQLQDALTAGQNITALRPIRDVLQAITDSLSANFGYDAVTLFPYRAETATFDRPVISGHLRFPDIVLKKVTVDALVEKRLVGPEFHFTSNPVNDVLLAGRFTKREGIQASGYVRLSVGNEVVGILFVNYRKTHTFTDDELGAVRLFANQAAIAIHNTRQYETLQSRLDQLEMTLAASQGIITRKPLRESLQMILDSLISAEGYDIATLIPYYPNRGSFGHALVAGQLQNYPEAMGRPRTVDTVVGRRLKEGPDEYFTPDAANDPLLAGSFVEREKVCAAASIRLRQSEQTVGLLFVNKREPHTFTLREQETLQLYAGQAAVILYDARLFRRGQERLEMLTRIGQEVGQSLLLETVLDTLYAQLRITFGPDTTPKVLLYDDLNRVLYHPYRQKLGSKRDIEPTPERKTVRLENSICGWVAKHKQGLNVPDVHADSRYSQVLSTTQSELAVPILLGERLVGVLDIESPIPNKFKEDDQRLLEAVANQVAAAIRNAEQYESSKKNRHKLSALHEAGKTITKAGLKIEAVLQTILEQAVMVTGANFGTIQLLKENALEFVAAWPSNRLEWLQRKMGRFSLDGPGITVRAIKLNDAQLVPDVSRDPDFIDATGQTGSELAVTLRRGGQQEGQVVGVLNVEHQEVGGLDWEDRRLLILLSNLAVVAWQNAKQYEELQEARDYGLASEAVAWLGLFGADWQHTINQKTFSIGNYTDALRRSMIKKDVPPDIADIVYEALDGIEEVTNSIRTVQFTGRVPSETPGETDGETTIDAEVKKFVMRWCNERQDIEQVFDLNCPGVRVKIPPQWLQVAMEKLINNALKAMPDSGRITVATHPIDNMVHITVEDTGHGIPDYAQADFLKRTINRPDGRPGGTGKGVIIARFVAHSYGGNLNLVHTYEGKGTKLCLVLPMLRDNSTDKGNRQ